MMYENTFESLKYVVSLPDDFDESKQYPAVFHTHGAGCRGTDTTVLRTVGILKQADNGDEALKKCIIFSPQCYANTWYEIFEQLIRFAEYVASLPYVDKTRFYASGISMGGYAIVQLMMSRPKLFAAGVVCCGGGMYWNAARLKEIPLWFFHGAQDKVVYPEESLHLCAKICAAGGNAKVTIYPNNDHNCWDDTYSNEAVYEWLFSYKKEG